MNNTFEFVGKILPCKATEKFKPYSDIKFESGWAKKTIKFNMVCGTNRHTVEASSLYNSQDLDAMTIYTFSKGIVSESGERIKGEKMTVSFKDRNKPEVIDKVAEFKKFVVDTEISGRRYALEKAIDKFKDGSVTDEQMENLGVHNIDETKTTLEESKKKKHEFISEYDFVDFLNKLVNSDKIKNMLFKVTGTYELEYSEKDDRWYRHFSAQRISRVTDNSEIVSHGTFGIIFGREAVDDNDYEATKKYHINGFIPQYLGSYKKTFFSPITLTIDGNGDEKAQKKAEGFKKKFVFPENSEYDYREIGVVCDMLDGAQKIEVTEDMLTDEQRENLEYGLITMEDIIKELGKDVYGDRITDIVIQSLARGYSSGAKETAYTEKDFCKPHIETDDVEDIFDEDIEI